jgi:hypothetical protein
VQDSFPEDAFGSEQREGGAYIEFEMNAEGGQCGGVARFAKFPSVVDVLQRL